MERLILSAGMLLIAPFSGVLTRMVPVRVLTLTGMVLIGGGLIWSAVWIDVHSGWAAFLPAVILMGLESGIVTPHLMGLAVGGAEYRCAGFEPIESRDAAGYRTKDCKGTRCRRQSESRRRSRRRR